MSGGAISVDPELVYQHTARIKQLRADADQALSAIRSINLSGGAFGLMCAWMVPPFAAVAAGVGTAIQAGEVVIEHAGVELRGLANDFQEFENTLLDVVRSLEQGLG